MGRMSRCCLQSSLKLVNSVIGMVGMGMILYAMWMFRAWLSFANGAPPELARSSSHPWFIYSFFGLGISFCLVTCSGHTAAETANSHCLFCYMVFVFLLLFLEAGITADVFLNRNWEEDFPEDRTGRFDEFKDFVASNSEICEWVCLSIVAAQMISLALAMILRTVGPDHEFYDDSDDDSEPARLPLLRSQVQRTTPVAETTLPAKNDFWKLKIHEKVSR